MARFRLSGPAQADLAAILDTSQQRWGVEGRSRYAALLAAALRAIAADPAGPTTRDRADLLPGVRSFHLDHARGRREVAAPVHVIYYRSAGASVIDIIRVLHERMDPWRHLDDPEIVHCTPVMRTRRARKRK
jgi:toxin ParE1/3/4